jgi:hypothetical protein
MSSSCSSSLPSGWWPPCCATKPIAIFSLAAGAGAGTTALLGAGRRPAAAFFAASAATCLAAFRAAASLMLRRRLPSDLPPGARDRGSVVWGLGWGVQERLDGGLRAHRLNFSAPACALLLGEMAARELGEAHNFPARKCQCSGRTHIVSRGTPGATTLLRSCCGPPMTYGAGADAGAG